MNKRSKLAALVGAAVLSLGVAGVALAATYDWQGNGYPNATCSGDSSTMLWIWTGDSPTSLTINGEVQSGSWDQQGNGAFHFTVAIDGNNYPPTTASVDYTGAAGTLTLSGCDEGGSPAPSGGGAGESDVPTATPGEVPTATPGGGGQGESDVPTQPSTDSVLGTGSSSPADSAWLLVVGLGVLLASIVVLTPARAKSRR